MFIVVEVPLGGMTGILPRTIEVFTKQRSEHMAK